MESQQSGVFVTGTTILGRSCIIHGGLGGTIFLQYKVLWWDVEFPVIEFWSWRALIW